MTPALIIGIILIVLVHDSLALFPLLDGFGAAVVIVLSWAPQVALCAVLWSSLATFSVLLHRSGRLIWVRLSDVVVHGWGWLAVLLHAMAVLVFGWLDVVRQWLGGDVVLIDEALACAPPLIAIVVSWIAQYPIERVLFEDASARMNDGELPRRVAPSRWQFVCDRARYAMLPVLLPIALLSTWSELVVIGVVAFEKTAAPKWSDSTAESIVLGGQFLGVVALILLAPVALKWMWRTAPMPESGLRDRLIAMCRLQKVRCSAPLVWRTRGQMLNGAVIGLVPPFRYVLLTDALIDLLSTRHVEAVMAHELAHARYRHLPWLIASMIGSVMLTWIGASWVIERFVVEEAWLAHEPYAPDIIAGVSMPLALLVGFVVFGFVSRRFERQADAFAVKHMAGAVRSDESRRDLLVSEDAAGAMSEALRQVARFNHIPVNKFTWRHGSIARRIRAIHRLCGRSVGAFPIDRQVKLIKLASAIAIVALVVLALRDYQVAE